MSHSATPITHSDLSVSMAEANLYALLVTTPPVELTIVCYASARSCRGCCWESRRASRGDQRRVRTLAVGITNRLDVA